MRQKDFCNTTRNTVVKIVSDDLQAANVILMRPHNWERFSFGAWLLNAAPRLHRNKLATALANKLARIALSILRNERTFDINRYDAMAI